MVSYIIETESLSKAFGDFQAVNNLSFKIEKGEVYGLLGQNGAGKSTTMRMLLGLIFPDRGIIKINGTVFQSGKQHLLQYIGAIIERPDMYKYLSGFDNLRMFAGLSGKNIPDKKINEVLDLVGLAGRENDKFSAYSQGMKQRLGLASTLIHDPDLLILDEPTNGLDPQGIADMRNLILRLSNEYGKTILISSHLLYEIEQVADSMLVIHKGLKVAEGKVTDLIKSNFVQVEFIVDNSEVAINILQRSGQLKNIKSVSHDSFSVNILSSEISALNTHLVNNGVAVSGIKTKNSLEEYFLSLTHA